MHPSIHDIVIRICLVQIALYSLHIPRLAVYRRVEVCYADLVFCSAHRLVRHKYVLPIIRQFLVNTYPLVGEGELSPGIESPHIPHLLALAVLADIRVIVLAAVYGRLLNSFSQYLIHGFNQIVMYQYSRSSRQSPPPAQSPCQPPSPAACFPARLSWSVSGSTLSALSASAPPCRKILLRSWFICFCQFLQICYLYVLQAY